MIVSAHRVFGHGAALALLVIGPLVRGQAPRIEITPDTVLLDERFSVAVDGVTPDKDVTIRVEDGRGVFHSSSTVRSDGRGHVDVADPMRLIWSAKGDRQAAPAGAAPTGAAP